jgi:hypothetical protein
MGARGGVLDSWTGIVRTLLFPTGAVGAVFELLEYFKMPFRPAAALAAVCCALLCCPTQRPAHGRDARPAAPPPAQAAAAAADHRDGRHGARQPGARATLLARHQRLAADAEALCELLVEGISLATGFTSSTWAGAYIRPVLMAQVRRRLGWPGPALLGPGQPGFCRAFQLRPPVQPRTPTPHPQAAAQCAGCGDAGRAAAGGHARRRARGQEALPCQAAEARAAARLLGPLLGALRGRLHPAADLAADLALWLGVLPAVLPPSADGGQGAAQWVTTMRALGWVVGGERVQAPSVVGRHARRKMQPGVTCGPASRQRWRCLPRLFRPLAHSPSRAPAPLTISHKPAAACRSDSSPLAKLTSRRDPRAPTRGGGAGSWARKRRHLPRRYAGNPPPPLLLVPPPLPVMRMISLHPAPSAATAGNQPRSPLRDATAHMPTTTQPRLHWQLRPSKRSFASRRRAPSATHPTAGRAWASC